MELIILIGGIVLLALIGIGFFLNSIHSEVSDMRWILSIAHRSELERFLKDLEEIARTSENSDTKRTAEASAQTVRKLIYRQ